MYSASHDNSAIRVIIKIFEPLNQRKLMIIIYVAVKINK